MQDFRTITSRENQYLKQARALHNKKGRVEQQAFLVEGLRLGEEALTSSFRIRYGLVSREALAKQERLAALCQVLLERDCPLYLLPDTLLQQVSATEHSQGLLLVLDLPEQPPALPSAADFIVLADRLADPGNLGTLMRTAWAVGANALVLTPGCADAFNPKVVRASMGAVLNLPLYQMATAEAALALLQAPGLHLLAALAGAGSKRYDTLDLKQPLAWLLGAEAEGLSPFWRAAAQEYVYLPMRAGVESLNVAGAAAVLLYETAKQRGFVQL